MQNFSSSFIRVRETALFFCILHIQSYLWQTVTVLNSCFDAVSFTWAVLVSCGKTNIFPDISEKRKNSIEFSIDDVFFPLRWIHIHMNHWTLSAQLFYIAPHVATPYKINKITSKFDLELKGWKYWLRCHLLKEKKTNYFVQAVFIQYFSKLSGLSIDGWNWFVCMCPYIDHVFLSGKDGSVFTSRGCGTCRQHQHQQQEQECHLMQRQRDPTENIAFASMDHIIWVASKIFCQRLRIHFSMTCCNTP